MLGEAFWNTVPYVTLAIVVVGTWWRYRYDKFGWTTRSSQLYESRLLRIGSPMFHFGILVVVAGHVIGLLIPESWTAAIGMSEHAYHVQAVTLGTIAGITTLAGAALLIYRRRTRGPVFMATTVNDKLMYVVLVAAIVAGLYATALGSGLVGEAYDYRQSVSIWFRSIWILQPRGDLALSPDQENRRGEDHNQQQQHADDVADQRRQLRAQSQTQQQIVKPGSKLCRVFDNFQ